MDTQPDASDVVDATDTKSLDTGEVLSPTGIAAIQGDEADESPAIKAINPAQGDDALASIHPTGKSPEVEKTSETEPRTVPLAPERKKPEPPEGWKPGSPER